MNDIAKEPPIGMSMNAANTATKGIQNIQAMIVCRRRVRVRRWPPDVAPRRNEARRTVGEAVI
ncbi:hypothetical protein MIAR_34490 [Microbacterium arabinogalactanolyticum]|nr:hypothetical protein MIAR_34490 [Microbacterium arabinogalactanolyticum]